MHKIKKFFVSKIMLALPLDKSIKLMHSNENKKQASNEKENYTAIFH